MRKILRVSLIFAREEYEEKGKNWKKSKHVTLSHNNRKFLRKLQPLNAGGQPLEYKNFWKLRGRSSKEGEELFKEISF